MKKSCTKYEPFSLSTQALPVISRADRTRLSHVAHVLQTVNHVNVELITYHDPEHPISL